AKAYFYQGHDIRYGARHLGRKMRTELEPILALSFLNQPEQLSLHLDCIKAQLVVVPEQAKA
ncbi:hypothetical protein, partial [Acinetobacter pecorum]